MKYRLDCHYNHEQYDGNFYHRNCCVTNQRMLAQAIHLDLNVPCFDPDDGTQRIKEPLGLFNCI